jgi:hypothetical protein
VTAAQRLPWPLRYIVDEDGHDTGFAMLRGTIGPARREAFARIVADHRLIGFTHYGPFPRMHEAYEGRRARDGATGWERPEIVACEAWAHCFRQPDLYLPPDRPRMLVSGSDFVKQDEVWKAGYGDGPPAKRWDIVYSCPPNSFNEYQKNWDLARSCLLRLADSGARILAVGRAGVPAVPAHRNIDVTGLLPWPDFIRATAQARVAFLPNRSDASPRVLTEALALDMPVLVNRQILGGWKYVEAETGRFFSDETDVGGAFHDCLTASFEPRSWLCARYGTDNAARRLAEELRSLGGEASGGPPSYALPTSEPPLARP